MSFFSWCQIVCFIMLVPNCPDAKLSGAKLSWCQIVRCQIVRCQIVRCQIVLPPYIRYHAKLTIQCNVVRCYFKAFSVISAVLGKHFVCFQVYTLTNRTEYYIPRNIKGKTSLPLSQRTKHQKNVYLCWVKKSTL